MHTARSESPVLSCLALFLRQKADVLPHPFSSPGCEDELWCQNTGQLQFPSFQTNVGWLLFE